MNHESASMNNAVGGKEGVGLTQVSAGPLSEVWHGQREVGGSSCEA